MWFRKARFKHSVERGEKEANAHCGGNNPTYHIQAAQDDSVDFAISTGIMECGLSIPLVDKLATLLLNRLMIADTVAVAMSV